MSIQPKTIHPMLGLTILLFTLASCGGGASGDGTANASSLPAVSSVGVSSVVTISSVAPSSMSVSSSRSSMSASSTSSSVVVANSQSSSSSLNSSRSSSLSSSMSSLNATSSSTSAISSSAASSVTNTVPNITTTSLPNGTFGSSYSQALVANSGNGSLVWSVSSGSLPQGLNLSSTGILSGTPNLRGTSNFTLKVADSDGVTGPSDEDTQTLSLVIDAVALPADVAKSSSPLVIVVLGSSTAAGKNLVEGGYNLSDRWPTRWENYLKTIRPGTVLHNLAIAGTGSCGNLPTNYPIPTPCLSSGSKAAGHTMADPNSNITKALSFNPNLIILAHPGDDAIGNTQLIINMQIIQDTASLAGVPIWFENAAPDYLDSVLSTKRVTQRDIVNTTFGTHAIDFWTPVVAPSPSIMMDVLYVNHYDDKHPNAEGHRVLYEAVKAKLDL